MRVVVTDGTALRIEERPDPEPGTGQLLVRVRATGVNGADIAIRAGGYPAPPGEPDDLPGLELAGEVAAAGPGTLRHREGDRVMALIGSGGHADLALVQERQALPVPDGVDLASAGGFVEVFATAHDALFTQAGLALGERLLVHGAAGGVGVAAVQLARAAGASVVATVRAEAVRERVAGLGADVRAPGDLEGLGPFDVILELAGGDFAEDVGLLATGGRLMVIGAMSGGRRVELDVGRLMQKRGRILASTLRPRPPEEKALVMQRLERHVLPLLAAGRVTTPVHATFPLAEAEAAYDAFVAGGKFGKIVLLA